MRSNLVLIGGRGAGKSTLSAALVAQDPSLTAYHLDALIPYEAGGRSIPELVADEGWAGFRAVEAEVVRKVSAIRGGALIDTGGGVIVRLEAGREVYNPANVAALKRHGRLVYLRLSTDQAIARIGDDPSRPALSDTASFAEVMARRAPWYERAADLVVDVGERSPSGLASELLAWLSAF